MGQTIIKTKKYEPIGYNSLTKEEKQIVINTYMNYSKEEFIKSIQVGFKTNDKQCEKLHNSLKRRLKF